MMERDTVTVERHSDTPTLTHKRHSHAHNRHAHTHKGHRQKRHYHTHTRRNTHKTQDACVGCKPCTHTLLF